MPLFDFFSIIAANTIPNNGMTALQIFDVDIICDTVASYFTEMVDF